MRVLTWTRWKTNWKLSLYVNTGNKLLDFNSLEFSLELHSTPGIRRIFLLTRHSNFTRFRFLSIHSTLSLHSISENFISLDTLKFTQKWVKKLTRQIPVSNQAKKKRIRDCFFSSTFFFQNPILSKFIVFECSKCSSCKNTISYELLDLPDLSF